MTNKRLLAACLAAAVLVPMFMHTPVRAAGTMNVSLSANLESAKAGDTIAVNVNFDTFPNITRFGPIEVKFDPAYVSFSGMDKGSAMPSTFSVSNTVSTSVVSITGVDQTVENQIAANQAAATGTDASGNPLPTAADPSMYSDSRVSVCVLYFKVIDTAATGDARFWLGNIGGFKNSALEKVASTAGDTVSVSIQSMLSTDASLSSLSVEGVTLSPEFSPTVFAYTAQVSRSVTEVNITAAATDTNAAVTITGNNNLLVGSNTAVVRVAAQDGKTAVEYTITITRSEEFVPEGASITDNEGNTYLFAELPQSLSIPSGFTQGTQVIGSQTVPAFTSEGIKSMILYLDDGENAPALYLYNPDTNTIRSFDSTGALTQSAQLLCITAVTSDVKIPDGFTETQVTVGEVSAAGYASKDRKTLLIYLTNEAGVSRFYVIDSANGELYPYTEAQSGTSFLIPFVIASVLAVAEIGMIVYIIYQVRSRNRPKEVRRV